jgi:UDP-glucuronate decarboxylase
MDADDSITGPINLGNPNEFTIMQLAELVVEMTGSRSSIEKHPLPEDDPRQRQPDITRARQVLAWEPHVALKEGLKKTIAYFDDRMRRGLIS